MRRFKQFLSEAKVFLTTEMLGKVSVTHRKALRDFRDHIEGMGGKVFIELKGQGKPSVFIHNSLEDKVDVKELQDRYGFPNSLSKAFTGKVEGSGGSGAGADQTKIFESLQCVYLGHIMNGTGRFSNPDDPIIDEADWNNAYGYCDVDASESALKSGMENIGKEWRVSLAAVSTALSKIWNKSWGNLDEMLSFGHMTFHRGSNAMKTIEKASKIRSSEFGARSRVDKWSPADIYVIDSAYLNKLKSDFDPKNFDGDGTDIYVLNEKMRQLFGQRTLVGISLKKTIGDNFKVKSYNQTNLLIGGWGATQLELTNMKAYKTKFWNAIDTYLYTSDPQHNEIQFRNFDVGVGSWQSEIKGMASNQGKAGGGAIDTFLKNTTGKPLFSRKVRNTAELLLRISTRAKTFEDLKPNGQFAIQDLHKIATPYDSELNGMDNSGFFDKILERGRGKYNSKFTVSKWLGLSMFEILNSSSKKQKDEFITKLFAYGYAKSEGSAPFLKVLEK